MKIQGQPVVGRVAQVDPSARRKEARSASPAEEKVEISASARFVQDVSEEARTSAMMRSDVVERAREELLANAVWPEKDFEFTADALLAGA
jgi:2,3-bisphosphoglycerate-independent phosphoglycerate mutase